jgi:hypothetical protein
MGKDQAFFDATAKGDLVSRLTLDATVLQATLAGKRRCRLRLLPLGHAASVVVVGAERWAGWLPLRCEGCLWPTLQQSGTAPRPVANPSCPTCLPPAQPLSSSPRTLLIPCRLRWSTRLPVDV